MKHQSLKAADKLFNDFIKALSETGYLVDLSAKGIYQLYSVGKLIENFTSLLTAVSLIPVRFASLIVSHIPYSLCSWDC